MYLCRPLISSPGLTHQVVVLKFASAHCFVSLCPPAIDCSAELSPGIAMRPIPTQILLL